MDELTAHIQQFSIADEKQTEDEEDTIKIYGLQKFNRAAGRLKCQYNPPPTEQKTAILPTPISEIKENNKLQNNVLHLDYDNNNDSYNQLSANKVTKEYIQLIIQLRCLNKPSNTLPFIFIPSAKRWKNAQLLLNENNSTNNIAIVFIVIDDDDKDKSLYIEKITKKNKPYHFIITLNQLSSGVPMVRQAIKMCAEYLLSEIKYEDNKYWIEIDDDINGFEYEYNHLNVSDGLNILYKSMLKIRKESITCTKPIIMSVASNKDRATHFDESKPYKRSLKCERVRIFKYCEELRNLCYVDKSTRIMNKEQWDLINELRENKSDTYIRELVQGKFFQGEDYGICEKLFGLESNNGDNSLLCLVNKAIKYNAQWGPGVKSVAGTLTMNTIKNALKKYDEIMKTKDAKICDITIEKLQQLQVILEKNKKISQQKSESRKKRKNKRKKSNINNNDENNNENNENNSSNILQSKSSNITQKSKTETKNQQQKENEEQERLSKLQKGKDDEKDEISSINLLPNIVCKRQQLKKIDHDVSLQKKSEAQTTQKSVDENKEMKGKKNDNNDNSNQHETMQIFIKTLTGTGKTLRVKGNDTINDIKHWIKDINGIPVEQQELVKLGIGNKLKDNITLDDYGIHNLSTLQLKLNFFKKK